MVTSPVAPISTDGFLSEENAARTINAGASKSRLDLDEPEGATLGRVGPRQCHGTATGPAKVGGHVRRTFLAAGYGCA